MIRADVTKIAGIYRRPGWYDPVNNVRSPGGEEEEKVMLNVN